MKPKRHLIGVRVAVSLHRRALALSKRETEAGRRLTVAEIYEAALRAFLASAGQ